MPTFQGLISEEGLMQLIAYIKSIGPQEAPPTRRAGRGADDADGGVKQAPEDAGRRGLPRRES
jgi:hypothetical protein